MNDEMKFTGIHYLLDFMMPNVYFHATTVYAILRHCGVELGDRASSAGRSRWGRLSLGARA